PAQPATREDPAGDAGLSLPAHQIALPLRGRSAQHVGSSVSSSICLGREARAMVAWPRLGHEPEAGHVADTPFTPCGGAPLLRGLSPGAAAPGGARAPLPPL